MPTDRCLRRRHARGILGARGLVALAALASTFTMTWSARAARAQQAAPSDTTRQVTTERYTTPGDTTRADAAVVRGTLHDSTADVPLAGALVQFAPLVDVVDRVDGPARAAPGLVSVRADSVGAFAAVRLAPGRWRVGFVHPALDVYGLELPVRALQLGPRDSLTLPLALPGPRALYAALCDTPPEAAADSVGAIVGEVRDAETGLPLPGARVALTWSELAFEGGLRMAERRLVLTSDAGGAFRACGVPTGGGMRLRAESGAAGDGAFASGELLVALAPLAVRRQDLAVGPVASAALVALASDFVTPSTTPSTTPTTTTPTVEPPGTVTGAPARAHTGRARLTGTVRDARGQPMAGVRVVVLGAERETRTGPAGTFALDALPSGSWTVEARAIGVFPVSAPVALSAVASTSVALRFAKDVPTLERVLVMGKASRTVTLMMGAERRIRRAQGRLFRAEDVEHPGVARVTDLLMRHRWTATYPISGLVDAGSASAASGGFGRTLQGRQGCVPIVLVDGRRIDASEIDYTVPRHGVLAVESYFAAEAMGVLAEFGILSTGIPCGLIVVWTK
jgi:hypothetical protein